jgi:hypothetical protein
VRIRLGGTALKTAVALVSAASLMVLGVTSAVPAVGAGAKYPYPVSQLKRALLARADLGTSFTVEPPATSGASKASGCPKLDAVLNTTAKPQTPSALVSLGAGNAGPDLSDQLIELSASTLKKLYADAEAGIKTCHSLTLTAAGRPIAFKLLPVDFSSTAAAARLQGTLAGDQVTAYISIEDVGSAELDYIYLEFGSGSPQAALSVFTKAVAKARKVLG